MTLTQLLSRGFDKSHAIASYPHPRSYHVECSQCVALCINGTPTHEHGCPNATPSDFRRNNRGLGAAGRGEGMSNEAKHTPGLCLTRLLDSHAELLAALRELLRTESTMDDGELPLVEARKAAHAALAKATL